MLSLVNLLIAVLIWFLGGIMLLAGIPASGIFRTALGFICLLAIGFTVLSVLRIWHTTRNGKDE